METSTNEGSIRPKTGVTYRGASSRISVPLQVIDNSKAQIHKRPYTGKIGGVYDNINENKKPRYKSYNRLS
jgi:hypothetical protein